MKYKLFFGLFGCSSDGVLYTPSYNQAIKLPAKLAFAIHTFINQFGYVGMKGTKLLFENKGI